MISANEIVSRNIKRIRQERNLTLDDLARLSGVSKSMLSEIERCAKSPTISMLEKICTGIHIPLVQLTYIETPDVSVIRKSNSKHYSTSKGFDTYNLFEFDPDKKFEMMRHVIAPHSERLSEYHEAGIREYIICTQGVLAIQVGKKSFELEEGEAIQFLANCNHKYANPTNEETHILMLMFRE
ncbi:helix-turn-helix domain-containing protein [Enterococcus avium]|uniref:helix-turn-helix domain-containing protein n=1 Tax=Enterococcus avium TaxID=33945 RepID=UPI0028927ED5|nr:XRE family transcriptional regulator [Enterococcus avium]MDT2457405.1 XRE family transcriptional regulator [Enterococcus avium]